MVTGDGKNEELTALMQRALGGDAASYRAFLTQAAAFLRRFLKRRVVEHDIEDIVQEILISIHKARHTYDGKRPVMPWIAAIARFRLADYLRQYYASMRHASVDITPLENTLFDVTKDPESGESIQRMLDILPQKQRNILTMMHLEGYTAKETGQRIGMSESAVKVSAHRAYKVIRKKLGNP